MSEEGCISWPTIGLVAGLRSRSTTVCRGSDDGRLGVALDMGAVTEGPKRQRHGQRKRHDLSLVWIPVVDGGRAAGYGGVAAAWDATDL